jgi:2-desacetyl-2-hydroxyethyl bacteriochlorophyllide A dehydrogenase
MRATIYNGAKSIEIKELDIPKAGPRDVVVKNMRAGICGTDIHAYTEEGESVGIHPNNQFGHEMVGCVYEVGKDVTGIKKGMPVFVNPITVRPVRKGWTATEVADMAGAFSEYILVEQAKLGYNLYLLPESMSFDRAVLTEPFSVATHGINMSRAKTGDRAVVYGAGTIGLCALAALKAAGVKDIIVADIIEKRLKLVQALGGISFNSKNGNLISFVKEQWGTFTGLMGEETTNADIIVDCAGFKGVLEEFMSSAKKGSRFVILALGRAPERVTPIEVVLKEVKIMGSCGYLRNDINQVIGYLSDPGLLIEPIITHSFGLSDVKKAFETACDKESAVKVVLNHDR